MKPAERTFATRTAAAALALLLAAAPGAHAFRRVVSLDEFNQFQAEFTLRPYEASAGVVGPFGETGIPTIDASAEEGIFYSETFRRLALPDFWSLELNANPVVAGGVVSKEWFRGFYDAADIRDGVNAIRVLTSGFFDLGSLVLGAGTEINVVDSSGSVVGRCHGGFALSSGYGHVVDNSIFPDLWTEPSFRIEGDFVGVDRELGWSFSFGTRFHTSPDVRNTLFFWIVRDRVDRWYSGWHPLRNTTIEYRIDFGIDALFRTGDLFGEGAVYNMMLVGKRWSIRKGRNTLGVKLGASYQWTNGYSGRVLRAAKTGWDLMIRPSLTF